MKERRYRDRDDAERGSRTVRKEDLVLSDDIMSAARTGGVLARVRGRHIDW
jgi:hypothetical protein